LAGVRTQTQRRKTSTHESFWRHRSFLWAKLAALMCVGIAAAYLIDARHLRPGPSGGTAMGYVLGTIAALLILWLAALGIRKRVITDGHYSLKAWVSAHVYLGLSLIVIATLHTGFHFGWNVHTLAYALMLLVIASGAVGVWAYATLPNALSGNRGETTRKQMLAQIESLDGQIHEAAQPLSRDQAQVVRLSLEHTDIGGGFWRRLFERYDDCANAEAIARMNILLRESEGEGAAPLVKIEELMRRKAEVLARARRQMHITALLEAWLFVHIPATFALLAALTVHIVSVFLYW
jgi:hypothetical protein